MRVPKRVWMLWFQGADQMPWVVQECYWSWRRWNPSWELTVLSDSNLREYVDLDLSALSYLGPAQKSDLIRLHLLSRYGGVWVDATCFCMRPLDEWLPGNLESGFFAFDRPGSDRLLSNWFLASDMHNLLVISWLRALQDYLTSVRFINGRRKLLTVVPELLLQRSQWTSRLWFTGFMRDVLRMHPYYASHYKFAEVIRTDPSCAEIWARTPRISADIPHRLVKCLFRKVPADVKAEIDRRDAPLYKLTWKHIPRGLSADCTLLYLFAHAGINGDPNSFSGSSSP